LFDIKIGGLEDHIRAVAREEVAAALAVQEADPWLDSKAAAEYLGLARSTVHDLVCSGALPRHGGRKTKIMLRRSELDAYLDARGRS